VRGGLLPRVGRAEVEQVVDAAASGAEEMGRGRRRWWLSVAGRERVRRVVVVWRRESQQVLRGISVRKLGSNDALRGCGLEVARQGRQHGQGVADGEERVGEGGLDGQIDVDGRSGEEQ